MNAGTWPGVSSVCCGPGSYPLRLVRPVRDAPRVRAQIVRVFSLGGIKDQRPRERLLTGLRGEQLDAWIARASAGDQPDLRSFITGLKRDYQAVLNGLTLPYSSGKVEGNVNRIKMLKRQMYGRARFDLLRKRVLLA